MNFTVIDKKTGEFPDLWKIALEEEWAKGLMYCDMEGFALLEDGSLLLLDECGKFEYCPEDRFIVVFENEASNVPRYTMKDKDGRYYIEGANGKLENDVRGHTYGEAIDRLAEFENADVVPRSEITKIFEEIETALNRKINRGKPQFENLKNREDFLSNHGHENMGYFKGTISACEDLQDVIAELKNKYE